MKHFCPNCSAQIEVVVPLFDEHAERLARIESFLVNRLPRLLEADMSDITTAITDLTTAVQGVAGRVTADLAALHEQIDQLIEDQGAAEQLHAAVTSIESSVGDLNNIDAPVVPAPEPTPEPAPVDETPTA